jgi:SSS family transporter
MTQHWVTYAIIICYLAGVAALGILTGGKQKTIRDYFIGATTIPWWIVSFSIVAAETSALTFISIPGLAYLGNFTFLQVVTGYIIGRVFVATLFLPRYFEGELVTAYAFLERRFGYKTRSLASMVFIFTRVAADGVRLFASAIPIKLMLGIDYPLAIIIIAAVTLIYTATGGVKGVIWVDAIQMLIYIGGAVLALFMITGIYPGGISGLWTAAVQQGKTVCINGGFLQGAAGFFKTPYTLIGGILGGTFLSMASHGTDQLVVQRLLATKNLSEARKAVVASGVFVFIQMAMFLLIGAFLFVFYGGKTMKADEVFPIFIISSLPPAATGIIIAGLLAAALSTLAGSISSMASSFMMDLYLPLTKKAWTDPEKLNRSRIITVFWAGLITVSAFGFMNSPKSVVELALSISSFTYGGLLGTFLAGILLKEATQEDALAGFLSGIFVMIAVIYSGLLGWTWFTLSGVITTLSVTYLLSKFRKS